MKNYFSFFDRILDRFGPFDIDLFASHTNAKCETFVFWFPDPFAIAVDTFTLDWSEFYFYIFPSFTLITQVLKKIINDKAEGILVVLRWPAQPWFPLFNKLCHSDLLCLDANPNLLFSPFKKQHPTWCNISLVIGKLSAKHSVGNDSQKKPSK